MFGLGHQSTSAQAWINGGNPTKGFLSGSVGVFSSFYRSIAGAGVVNWLFMLELLAIAVSLSLGIAMRLAAAAGSVMLVLMWSAPLPPQDNLFLDNHIIYALLLNRTRTCRCRQHARTRPPVDADEPRVGRRPIK